MENGKLSARSKNLDQDSKSPKFRGLPEALAGGGAGRMVVAFLLVFGLGMALITLFGGQGWLAYQRLEDESVRLRQEVTQMETRQQLLKRELEALRNDPEYIELLARQRLGLVRPGERVIQVPPDE